MNIRLLTPMIAVAFAAVSHANIVFNDNFDVDSTANWAFFSNKAGDTASQADGGSAADFFFDYSTVGIAAAPNSNGTTRGLRMQTGIVNTQGTAQQHGMSVSPINFSVTGDYTLKFDAWLNFNGPAPAGGNGSTQITLAGIGVAGTSIVAPNPGMTGTGFATTGDGGTNLDWRVYNGSSTSLDPSTNPGTYAAGNTTGATNNSAAYYTGLFAGSAIPAAQSALAPVTQVGTAAAGTTAFTWTSWEIARVGTTVTWKVNGNLIATVANGANSGSNFFLGQSDINTTISTDPNSLLFQFGLVDNVTVDAVPEPATMAVLGLGALAALKRRKKK